jgi:hypothetical protein
MKPQLRSRDNDLVSRTRCGTSDAPQSRDPVDDRPRLGSAPRRKSGALRRVRGTSGLRPYLTTPEVNPAFLRGGLMSFFRKHCASFPA